MPNGDGLPDVLPVGGLPDVLPVNGAAQPAQSAGPPMPFNMETGEGAMQYSQQQAASDITTNPLDVPAWEGRVQVKGHPAAPQPDPMAQQLAQARQKVPILSLSGPAPEVPPGMENAANIAQKLPQIAGAASAFVPGEILARIPPGEQDAAQAQQDVNEAIGARAKAIRMGKRAATLDAAATNPGRGLINEGFTADTLRKMTPQQQLAAVSPKWDAAGQAIDRAIADATAKGSRVNLDLNKLLGTGSKELPGEVAETGKVNVFQKPAETLNKVANPKLQAKAIAEYDDLLREMGISDPRSVTPAQAQQLRRALNVGARFREGGDLSSLSAIRSALRQSVSSALKEAVPGLDRLDQRYSDLNAAMDEILYNAKKAAVKSTPSTIQKVIQHPITRKVAIGALEGLGAGAAAGAGWEAVKNATK